MWGVTWQLLFVMFPVSHAPVTDRCHVSDLRCHMSQVNGQKGPRQIHLLPPCQLSFVSNVRCNNSGVRCQMSDVMYHLLHVRKGNSKPALPLSQVSFQVSSVRCQVSAIKCQVSNYMCTVSSVRCHPWEVRNVRKSNIKSHYCPLVRYCV